MSYEPTQWNSGDIVTSAKLNKLEQGVANAGGGSAGGALVIHEVNGTLDKTWQEIHDAAPSVTIVINEDGNLIIAPVFRIGADGVFIVIAGFLSKNGVQPFEYTATSADGYPVLDQG